MLQESRSLCHPNAGRKPWKCHKKVLLTRSQPSLAEARYRWSLWVLSNWNSLFYSVQLCGINVWTSGYCSATLKQARAPRPQRLPRSRAQPRPPSSGPRGRQGLGLGQTRLGWTSPAPKQGLDAAAAAPGPPQAAVRGGYDLLRNTKNINYQPFHCIDTWSTVKNIALSVQIIHKRWVFLKIKWFKMMLPLQNRFLKLNQNNFLLH